MLGPVIYFLRFVTIVAVVMTCLGNARTNAQTTALVDVIAVVKSIPAGTAFLERNGIPSSGSAAEILTQIQNLPPEKASVMAAVLGEFGLRMEKNSAGNTLEGKPHSLGRFSLPTTHRLRLNGEQENIPPASTSTQLCCPEVRPITEEW
jgi:hypothetical protein